MVGVIVSFRYGADFDQAKVRKIAEGARSRFEGMAGLALESVRVRCGKTRSDQFLRLGLG